MKNQPDVKIFSYFSLTNTRFFITLFLLHIVGLEMGFEVHNKCQLI